MAYIALWSLIGMVIYLGIATLIDSAFDTKIIDGIQKIQNIFIWAAGFLASIVATYYGMSSFRPSS